MIVEEQSSRLTIRDRLEDLACGSYLTLLLLLPLILLIIVFIVCALIYEYLVEKPFYRLTGRKEPMPLATADPLATLPVKLEVRHLWSDATMTTELIEKYNLNRKRLEGMDLTQINSSPAIPGLRGKWFDIQTVVIKNKVIVQEIDLVSMNSTIAYIDCDNLTYNPIKQLSGYPAISYLLKEDFVEVRYRANASKQLLRLRLG